MAINGEQYVNEELGGFGYFMGPTNELLGDDPVQDGVDGHAADHTLRTAPILTGDAFRSLGPATIPQCALYGRVLQQHVPGLAEKAGSPELLINSNAPFSAVVCGVQGSGKSHSTSVLLESCLIRDNRIGSLPAPLSGLVFHFDTAAGGGLVQPCEAAYLASLDAKYGRGATPPPVVVLVLPSNLGVMRRVYAGLPGVRVEPLHFAPEDISGDRLLAMMKVDESNQLPLYMETIMTILRSMDEFDYEGFRAELKAQKFSPTQKSMLNQRLLLLDSCLKDGNAMNRVSQHFQQGQLTIIDLSSPFMDGSSACGFFDLILGLFVEAEVSTGKLVVLDEAHKYLTDSGSSSRLTESLLAVVRQQRHLNTRVIVSTQEPTVVPPRLLDLCSFILAHRFSSPKWLHHLAQHVSAAEAHADALFSRIVTLQTGQAILFAPAGLGLRTSSSTERGVVTPFGQGYLLVRSRLRITRDGGHSLLAIQEEATTTRLGRVPRRTDGYLEEAHRDSHEGSEETSVEPTVQGDAEENEMASILASEMEKAASEELHAEQPNWNETVASLALSRLNGNGNTLDLPEPADEEDHFLPGDDVALARDRKPYASNLSIRALEDPAARNDPYPLAEKDFSEAEDALESLSECEDATTGLPRPSCHRRTVSLPAQATTKPEYHIIHPADDVDVHLSLMPDVHDGTASAVPSSDTTSDYATAHPSPDPQGRKLPSDQASPDILVHSSPPSERKRRMSNEGMPRQSTPSSHHIPEYTETPTNDTFPAVPVLSTSTALIIWSGSTSQTSTKMAVSKAAGEKSSGTVEMATYDSVEDVPECFRPLVQELLHQADRGFPQISLDVVYHAVRDFSGVPYYYKPFLSYIQEARDVHLVSHDGPRLALGPAVAALAATQPRPVTPPAVSPTPDIASSAGRGAARSSTEPVVTENVAKQADSSTMPETFHTIGDVPERFRPLVEELLDQARDGLVRLTLDVVFYAVRGKPGVPENYNPFIWYIREARDAGLIADEGWRIGLTPALRGLLAPTPHPMSSTAKPPEKPAAAPIPSPIPNEPTGSTSSLTTSSRAEAEGSFAPLVAILKEYQVAGQDRCPWTLIGEKLRQRAPSALVNKKLAAYLKEAADVGWVEVGLVASGAHWVQLLPGNATVSKPLDISTWHPLVRLFKEKGKTRINMSDVAGLKARYPDLIPPGKGRVKAYVQSAVDAKLAKFEDQDWIVLTSA